MQYFGTSITKVLLPSFSQLQDEKKKIQKYLLFLNQLSSYVLFPVVAVYIIFTKDIVYTILGKNWIESIPLV